MVAGGLPEAGDDLFVGVASVGNDPSWIDGGAGVAEHHDYWHGYSFGELSTTAAALCSTCHW